MRAQAADATLDLRTTEWYGATFPASVTAMAVESNRLHVALGPAGLTVINIDNPWLPVRLGTVETAGNARDVFVSRGFAYVADDSNGLVIVDVRDGSHPTIRSRLQTAGGAWSVVVRDSTAYVADTVEGLLAIDVRDQAHPVRMQRIATPQPIQDLAIQGEMVLAATGLDGLRAFRFPTNGAPSEAWHIPDPTPFPGASNRGITAVAAGPEWAVYSVANSGDVHVLDLGSGIPPRVSSHIAVSSSVTSMVSAGDNVLLADRLYTSFRFRIPGRPAFATHTIEDRNLGGPTSASAMAVSGDFVFQFDPNGLLYVSDAAQPAVLTLPVMGRLGAVRLDATDSHAFVTRWNAGLQIFDLLTPGVTEPIARVPFPGFVTDLATQNGYLFLVDTTDRLRIIDVRDPKAPVELPPKSVQPLIPDIDSYASLMRLSISGERAYISTWSKGLFVLDISNPGSIQTISQLFNKSGIVDVVVRDTLGMLVDSNRATFVDLASPTNPVVLGEYSLHGIGGYGAIEGDRAYITDGAYGLHILDIANPRALRALASLPMHNAPVDVAVRDGLVSMITARGLEVLDARNPAAATLVGVFPPRRGDSFAAVCMNHGGIFATDPAWGILSVHSLPGFQAVLRVQNAPADRRCTIEWTHDLATPSLWSPLATLVPSAPTFQLIDTEATHEARFFRLSLGAGP